MPNFLVGYDYGTGGVWGIVDSPSEDEINRIYPELQVFRERPSFIIESTYEKICLEGSLDVHAQPAGILKAILIHRAKAAMKSRGNLT